MFPKVYDYLFKINNAYCHYIPRQSNNLYLPKCKLSISQIFLTYRGILLWNYISTILSNSDFLCFKRQLNNLLEHDVNI